MGQARDNLCLVYDTETWVDVNCITSISCSQIIYEPLGEHQGGHRRNDLQVQGLHDYGFVGTHAAILKRKMAMTDVATTVRRALGFPPMRINATEAIDRRERS